LPEFLGRGAHPGLAKGVVCFAGQEPPTNQLGPVPFILVCLEGGVDDRELLHQAEGVLALRAGLTGDIAIMARVLGKPCVVSCHELSQLGQELSARDGSRFAAYRALMTLDGASGTINLEDP
jgi:phosphoenolpyruvate synthase/pyruvate phosphate dikinase